MRPQFLDSGALASRRRAMTTPHRSVRLRRGHFSLDVLYAERIEAAWKSRARVTQTK